MVVNKKAIISSTSVMPRSSRVRALALANIWRRFTTRSRSAQAMPPRFPAAA
jgi:hypothetical protein